MYITEEWKAYWGSILCVLYVNFLMNAVYATEISIKVYKIFWSKNKNKKQYWGWPLKREHLDN